MLRFASINYCGTTCLDCRFAPDVGSPIGGGSNGDSEAKREELLRSLARAAVASELANNRDLSANIRRKYQECADSVIERMPQRALELWRQNFRGIDFYPSANAVNLKSREFKTALGQRIDPRKFTAAFIDASGRIHINGGSDLGQKAARTTAQYYAHEFAHMIDAQGTFSDSPEWKAAWKEDSAAIKIALAKDESQSRSSEEGFAHFLMPAWLYRPMAERHFPNSFKLLVQWELV